MNLQKIKSKKVILLIIFLLTFIIGTSLIFTVPSSVKATYGLTAKTDDGIFISLNIFEPVGRESQPKPAVLIGHGVMANKEFMKGYAIELAAAGFVAVPFDFRGHGQSTGELDMSKLVYDVNAVIKFLNTTSCVNVDINNLGYIGYSMGGFAGNPIVNSLNNFKCYIGVATVLENIRIGNSSNHLNVLMVQDRYDEAFDLTTLKINMSNRIGISVDQLDVNQLYGSFDNGNASMIYLDDNSEHLMVAWDPDFIRASRNWVMNTFPSILSADENFYVNIRGLILLIQLIGGLGFFFLIFEPISKLILNPQKKGIKIYKIELRNTSEKELLKKSLLYITTVVLPMIGFGALSWLILTPLPIAGLMVSYFFGLAFVLFILLWRKGKKEGLSSLTILKQPFKDARGNIIRQIILGAMLAVILYLILYFSIGLNYFGIVPSISKIWWTPIYFIGFFIVIIIASIAFLAFNQSRLESNNKNIIKTSLIVFGFLAIFTIEYIILICLVMRNTFLLLFILVILPIMLLTAFVSIFSYVKTGNIIVGSIIITAYLTAISCTVSPLGIGFLLMFQSF